MPAKSERQRRLMGAALTYKRGEYKHASPEIIRIAKSMSEQELEEMASKPEKKISKLSWIYSIAWSVFKINI